MAFKKEIERCMGNPSMYMESVGMNNTKALASYVFTMEQAKPGQTRLFLTHEDHERDIFDNPEKKNFGFFTVDKRCFQRYMNKLISKASESQEKQFLEKTGDADFITSEENQKVWKKAVDNGLRAKVMMNCDAWNPNNPRILEEMGVEVYHLTEPNDYHFGYASPGSMFSLNRYPADPNQLKVQSMSQFAGQTKYEFFGSNIPSFVDKTKSLWDELKKGAISFKDQKARLGKNGKMDISGIIV